MSGKGKCVGQRIGQWLPEGGVIWCLTTKDSTREFEGEFGTVLYLNCTGGYMC